MSENKKKIIVILGPTACGKTGFAIKLAEKYNGEIICADSRTVYKGLDIGTAKPTIAFVPKAVEGKPVDIDGIPHYMIDIISPDQEFTVAQFKQQVLIVIKSIHKKNKIPFLVGGSGLYISSIVNNLKIPHIPPDKKIRKKIENLISKHGLSYAYNKLIKLDPGSKNIVQSKNPRRIIRALEVCLKTGKPFSKLRKMGKPLFNILQIGIFIPREKLYQRINSRTDKMIKQGLFNEVKKLYKKYGKNQILSNTIGYQEFLPFLKNLDHLDAEPPSKIIAEEIKKNTRHYARRQMSWFNRDKHIKWIKNNEQAERLIEKFLN